MLTDLLDPNGRGKGSVGSDESSATAAAGDCLLALFGGILGLNP
jgi:hypothetical protein